MLTSYKKIDLFGKTLIQKVAVTAPFEFPFIVSDYACFIFSLKGDVQLQVGDVRVDVPCTYSLFLNCLTTGKKMVSSVDGAANELVIVSFHPDILKKIYDRELPGLLQPPGIKTNHQSSERISNNFLIAKYIDGLLFYLENPSLVSDEILVLKMKEIILLLSQTPSSEAIQVILSQLFSPATYTFKQVIEMHIFRQVAVEELAQKTNLSVSTFKREFSRLYNDSPANYIRNRRLEKAAELLASSDQRITDIAYECGFNDLANFTKTFHEKYKVTPTSYRLNQIAK